MTIYDAEKIVNKYGAALTVKPEVGLFRKLSLLPTSKENVIKAFKLQIAFLIEYKSWNDETKDTLITPLFFLAHFREDKEVERFIKTDKLIREKKISLDDKIAIEYNNAEREIVSESLNIKLDGFIEQVNNMDTKDALYHQRVYTLIGLEYSPKVEKAYDDICKKIIYGR